MNEKDKNKSKVRQMTGVALLAALIVVLQLAASAIKIGPFSITLSLVPIVIGAVLFGPNAGGVLGLVFGGVVTYSVVIGADRGGFLMFQANAVATVAVCLLKSGIAGYVAGLAAKYVKGNAGIVLAAVLCPLLNTGIFCLALVTIFKDIALSWARAAGARSLASYVLFGLVGLNFLVEMAVDILLTPTIIRIINLVSKK